MPNILKDDVYTPKPVLAKPKPVLGDPDKSRGRPPVIMPDWLKALQKPKPRKGLLPLPPGGMGATGTDAALAALGAGMAPFGTSDFNQMAIGQAQGMLEPTDWLPPELSVAPPPAPDWMAGLEGYGDAMPGNPLGEAGSDTGPGGPIPGDNPQTDFVPEWKPGAPIPYGGPTLQQILQHRGGMGPEGDFTWSGGLDVAKAIQDYYSGLDPETPYVPDVYDTYGGYGGGGYGGGSPQPPSWWFDLMRWNI